MELSPAAKAWTVLVGGVVAYDMLCPPGETLSEGVDRALEMKRGRFAVIGAVAITAAHLLNAIPQDVDPIHQAVELRKKKLRTFDNWRGRDGTE